MQSHDVALLFDHLYWVRDKILAAADDPAMDWPGEAPVGLRGLRATLVHELDVEWSWRRRLQADDRRDFPADDVDLVPEDFDDVAAVRARWLEDEAEMRAWLGRLPDADLAGPRRRRCAAPGARRGGGGGGRRPPPAPCFAPPSCLPPGGAGSSSATPPG